jgi:hypothetical protein
MSSTFAWQRDNGAATGSPTHGTTRGAASVSDWKSVDDNTTAFSAAGVQQGLNSFEAWLYGKWTGTYSNIFAVLWAHTAGAMPGGSTLKGVTPATYTTPSQSTNSNLTVDMTSVISIGSGQSVNVGATGPEAAGHAASTNANPAFTDYLATQVQLANNATVGDSPVITQMVQWNEN